MSCSKEEECFSTFFLMAQGLDQPRPQGFSLKSPGDEVGVGLLHIHFFSLIAFVLT